MDPWLGDLERYVQESKAAAERRLPQLLELSGRTFTRELGRHPELQPGLTMVLLERAHGAVDRDPARAHELTVAVLAQPAACPAPFRDTLIGRAWTTHADALRALGRYGQAHDALGAALESFGRTLRCSWYLADADVVRARILHEEERAPDEVLRRLRHAAGVFLFYGGVEDYIAARAIEAWIHWEAGDRNAAAAVWSETAGETLQRGNVVGIGLLHERMGILQLRHGFVEEAATCFDIALDAFQSAGRTSEALRARWHLAETAAARGDFDAAIAEFHRVQAMMLGARHVTDAAVATAEILELLLVAGRDDEVLPLAGDVVETFTHAGLTLNALRAWTFVRQRARAGQLTVEDVTAVRVYFERLPLRPNARFQPPDPHR